MSEQERPYTVVVGVSATSKSPTALTWGKAQADANGGRLIAVRVHADPPSSQANAGSSRRSAEASDLRSRQQAALEQDVAAVLGEGHQAEVRVIHSGKRRGLINVAQEADILVLDAPQGPSMSPLLAQRLIYTAPCPVVVMPPSLSGAPKSAMSRSARAVGRAALKSAGTSGRAGYRPPTDPGD
jgi:hypothetical protein